MSNKIKDELMHGVYTAIGTLIAVSIPILIAYLIAYFPKVCGVFLILLFLVVVPAAAVAPKAEEWGKPTITEIFFGIIFGIIYVVGVVAIIIEVL